MVAVFCIVALLAVGLLAGCGGKGGAKASGTGLEAKSSAPDKHKQVENLKMGGGAAGQRK